MRESLFTWTGEFENRETEAAYRVAGWPELMGGVGRISALSAVGFLIMGYPLFMKEGMTPLVSFLTLLRAMVAVLGLLPMVAAGSALANRFVPCLTGVFLLSIGCYESVAAVLTYTPGMELTTPYTLLIVLLFYLVIPLLLKPILVAGVISSIMYVCALRFFAVGGWASLIQLILFFALANGLGASIFIEMARWRRTHFTDMAKIRQLNQRLRDEVIKKEETNRHLERLAVTDTLTGVGNRRKFLEVADMERHRAFRYGVPFSVVMLDIDHFKEVNDRYGHEGGDVALCDLARVVEGELRGSDLLVRLGGEEFAMLLPETRQEEAYALAERVRRQVAGHVVRSGVLRFTMTVSMGVAEVNRGSDDSVKGMLNRADEALYQAKALGRNRTELYTPKAEMEKTAP